MLPPLVADMDIAAPVVHFLRAQGVDVLSAREEGWGDLTDSQILARAHAMTRFVLTHDSDNFAEHSWCARPGRAHIPIDTHSSLLPSWHHGDASAAQRFNRVSMSLMVWR
jgi:hypothetical protein